LEAAVNMVIGFNFVQTNRKECWANATYPAKHHGGYLHMLNPLPMNCIALSYILVHTGCQSVKYSFSILKWPKNLSSKPTNFKQNHILVCTVLGINKDF